MVEFISGGKQTGNEQYSGRTSGSKEWRESRGEIGSSPSCSSQQSTSTSSSAVKQSKSIIPSAEELQACLFYLEYNPVTNAYLRSNNGKEVREWQSLVTRYRNVARKEELDWKKVYLCRKEEGDKSPTGFITWKIEIPDTHAVQEVDVLVKSCTYESGQVSWILCSEHRCDLIHPSRNNKFSQRYKGDRVVSITAYLRGGNGDCAWQHTQLFREDLNSAVSSEPPFNLKIKMYKL